MKFFTVAFALSAAVASVSAAPSAPLTRRDVDAALVPDFGRAAGINPTGTGDCDGVNNAAGVAIKVPCACPPDRASFLQAIIECKLAAGRAVNNPTVAVSFPTDDSKTSKLARIGAALVTLQNLHGPGQGCPASSTTFVTQQKAIQDGTDTPAAPAPAAGGVDVSLVPDFGRAAGINPTGTGDCDGVNNAAGVPIKVPCSCPPDRASFITSLNANVAAGHAVNNPTVAVSFPTDDSKASKLARIGAALVTLQNLHGSGQGCPASSTTFVAQQKAIQDGTDAPAPAPAPAPVPAPAAPAPAPAAGGVDVSLVPDFGRAAGINPTGSGDCDGVNNAAGVAIKVPCSCPPDRASFIASLNANVAAGHAVNNPTVAVSFPTDNSKASKLARIGAALVTLQNLHGSGQGCPASSTTFVAQQKAIQDGADTPAPAPAAPAPAPAPAPAAGGVDVSLVPDFGRAAGINPTGTGDCDGITNAAGVVVKVPCSCPPDRASFIASLNANVAAGHAVNNPTVNLSFPTDGSKASKLARIGAALVTLQNLRGPGQGCPPASTTFVAQQTAIQNGS